MTTLQTIIDDCRRRADMKVNQFWTDADFTSEINKSLSQLDMILISKFNDYKLTAVLTSVTAGTNLLALPSDFLKLRGLDLVTSSSPDGYVKVHPFAFSKRNAYNRYGISGFVSVPDSIMYRLQGSSVYLVPETIASNYQYRLWYTPKFTNLASVSESLPTYMDSQAWFDYAVLDVCAKVLAAQDLNPQTFQVQKEELKEMIIKLSTPNRDAGEPAFMVDERDW